MIQRLEGGSSRVREVQVLPEGESLRKLYYVMQESLLMLTKQGLSSLTQDLRDHQDSKGMSITPSALFRLGIPQNPAGKLQRF